MIPLNKIIDDYDFKKSNTMRDVSFKKFCNELDMNKIFFTVNTDEEGVKTEIKSKIDHIKVIRGTSGELILWETHYKTVVK